MQKNYSLRKLLFIAACFTFAIANVKAQTNPIKNAFASISEANGQSTATFTVEVADTNSILEIRTQLGSYRDSSDLVNQLFDYDVTTGLPSGVTYQRTGNKLTLAITGFSSTNTYFGKVSLKSNNDWSHFKFITNSSTAND